MKSTPKVFIDTAIFRYATSIKLIQTAKLKDGTITSKDGETKNVTFLVYENIIKDHVHSDENLEMEKAAIRKIAELSINEKVSLCYSHEVNLELLFQPEIDLVGGRIHGAPCHIVHSPLLKADSDNFHENDQSEYPFSFWDHNLYTDTNDIYERVKNEFFRLPINCFISRLNFKSTIAGLRETDLLEANASKLMYQFLKSIKNDRYEEILKHLNAQCVSERKIGNLYMDAYHLWTAEKSKCEYFLTTEKALINQFRSNITKAITPSSLALIIDNET